MHEIITIQIGSQACFAGTHFWNAQESYFTYGEEKPSPIDHQVHFREGKAQDGSDTFTPRVLIYDFKQAFGTLKQGNALYQLGNEETSAMQMLGTGNIIREDPIQVHPYQIHLDDPALSPNLNLDNVRFWSDYNRVFYHPRSLVPINTDISIPQIDPTSVWGAGETLFDKENGQHEIFDEGFRYFAESCDQMQGVMMMMDIDSAWGGFGSRYMESLRDELNKGVIMVWGLEKTVRNDERSSSQESTRLLNSVQSTFAVASKASLYSPLTSRPKHQPAYLKLHTGASWHTSAFQITAIETLTLPSRLHKFSSDYGSLGSLEQFFTNRDSNRKILRTEMTLNGNVQEVLEHLNGHDTRTSLPQSNIKEDPKSDIIMTPELSRQSKFHVFDRFDVRRGSVYPDTMENEGENYKDPIIRKFGSDLSYPLPNSFPEIFQAPGVDVGHDIYASMSSDSRVSVLLRDYANFSRRLLPTEEREEVSNELQTWAEAYIEGWESNDEDDWDD